MAAVAGEEAYLWKTSLPLPLLDERLKLSQECTSTYRVTIYIA